MTNHSDCCTISWTILSEVAQEESRDGIHVLKLEFCCFLNYLFCHITYEPSNKRKIVSQWSGIAFPKGKKSSLFRSFLPPHSRIPFSCFLSYQDQTLLQDPSYFWFIKYFLSMNSVLIKKWIRTWYPFMGRKSYCSSLAKKLTS